MLNFSTLKEAHNHFADQIEELEYVDNFRYAFQDTPEEVAEFEEAERNGCCGVYHIDVLVDNRRYMMGCNYGH